MLKKILITGGNSFLAKNFLEKLRGDYHITSCNRSELDLNDSITVYEYLKAHRFDVVIHTATYDAAPKGSLNNPEKVLENNLKMFFNIVRGQEYFGKMLYFGSGAEFERSQWALNMPESSLDKYVPTDQYGFSKYVMSQTALDSQKIFNLRLFSVFGQYDDWRYRFVSNACCHAVMGLPIRVHQNSKADFLYIDDLVKIVRWFIDNQPKHQIYNVCSGYESDYVNVAKLIQKRANSNLEVIVDNVKIGKMYGGDNSLLLQELGKFDFTPLEMALDLQYDWFKNNKNIIDVNQFHF